MKGMGSGEVMSRRWRMRVRGNEVAMLAYVGSGAHRAAMAHLARLGLEASVVGVDGLLRLNFQRLILAHFDAVRRPSTPTTWV